MTLFDRLVGPVTPGRIGGVFGYVAGFAAPFLWWWAQGDIPNLVGLVSILVTAPLGALVGWLLGRYLGRKRSARAKEPS